MHTQVVIIFQSIFDARELWKAANVSVYPPALALPPFTVFKNCYLVLYVAMIVLA